MIVKRGDGSYPRVYRPCAVSEVYGQEEAKTYIENSLHKGTLNNTLLFHGVTGTGKTSLARVIAMGLTCKRSLGEPCGECESCRQIRRNNHFAYQEFNCAKDIRGVEHLRKLAENFVYGAMGYNKKIIVFDECQVLSTPAQTLLNHALENSNEETYYVLCTIKRESILEPLRGRCIGIEFKEIPPEQIKKLLHDVCKWERIKYHYDVLNTIVEKSKGRSRNALFLLQQFVDLGKVEKMEKKENIEIIDRESGSNILIIAPHGVYYDDDYTGVIARHLANSLEGYAVINEKYQKPKTVEFKEPDFERALVDLNQLKQIKKYDDVKKEFLDPIDEFKKRIRKEYGKALIVQIHGIKDDNMRRVAQTIKEYKKHPENLHVLIGFGQKEGGKQPLTVNEKETILPLIEYLKQNQINAAIAPKQPIIDDDGDEKLYCGNDSDGLNQYLRDTQLKVQSIQLEIRNSGFRDDQETARKMAELLGKTLSKFILKESEDRVTTKHDEVVDTDKVSFWTALSEKSIDKRIKVKEIDLSDRKFESRMSDYGVNREKFDNLVKDIMSKGIVQNIIVRKVSDKEQYQLISGFRRLSALQKAFEERSEQESFQEALVSAKIFESLSDEDAYAISFSENLEREDLSLWEIANSCRIVREDLLKIGKSKSDIESHLASLIKKDARTVRRYLRVSTIQNKDIRKDIHNGKIDITAAIVFTREDLMRGEKQILRNYYRNRPMPSRKFESFVRNLLELRNWSRMKVEKILEIPMAHIFLTFGSEGLKEKVKYIEKTTNKPIDYILKHYIEYLKKSLDSLKTQEELKPFMERFIQQSKSMEEKIGQVFKTKKVGADISIKPAKNVQDKRVEVTIAAPADNIQEAIKLMVEELKDDFVSLESLFHDLPNDLPQKEGSKKPKTYGTKEWSENSVNCCSGCSHDCRYCYAKGMAVRFGQLTYDKWKEERIRKEDVDKKYGLIRGTVMFPSSHDITPTNFSACITVLEKLLKAGNRVLIVSKPHLECISKICNTFIEYKDNILFRFTITACDDKILSFWEPNSPAYEERKACLKYAYDAGFKTSVSVEPMVDSDHIEDLVKNLSSLVTDAIWIGKMNYLGSIRKDDESVKEAVRKIEAGQTDDKIKLIYKKFKDNPLIKWKSSIKKIVGIPLPTEPGMDI